MKHIFFLKYVTLRNGCNNLYTLYVVKFHLRCFKLTKIIVFPQKFLTYLVLVSLENVLILLLIRFFLSIIKKNIIQINIVLTKKEKTNVVTVIQ